jgi:hypothetical protein
VGDKPQWHGVKHIQDWLIVCGSASIAFGTNETHMDESKVARVTGWSFGLLSLALLGLTVLKPPLRRSRPMVDRQ